MTTIETDSATVAEEKDFDLLPVEQFKDLVIESICCNQIVVCIGETGSGKTTKIPQFCLDSGLFGGLKIGITQPRRVAAISVAQRVADERKTTIGTEVGYVVRFDDRTSETTRIKYLTDGVLVREILNDPVLSQYGIIILDEAHERSIHTDILFGLVKRACSLRPDFKVLVTSATLNSERFSQYFSGCPVIQIPGRCFPVDIYHSKTKQIMTSTGPSSNGYIQSAVELVLQIHRKEDEGHILVFFTGQDEIEDACRSIRAMTYDSEASCPLVVLPLYGTMPAEEQKKVFVRLDADGQYKRKCIVATNVAETSITVPRVRFVIDAGFVKQKAFDPIRRIETLVVVPISKVSAQQRAGRAGRTGPGQCYRLYSTDCYNLMMDETIPEILRSNLANTILYLKVLGVDDVMGFDFIEPPDVEQIAEALVVLHILGAIDSSGLVTQVGRVMSEFPVEPTTSKMIVTAAQCDPPCFDQVVAVAAMISSENFWISPTQKSRQRGSPGSTQYDELRAVIEKRHSLLMDHRGDHLTLLKVFEQFEAAAHLSSEPTVGSPVCRSQHRWCEENFIRLRAMQLAVRIRDQLKDDAARVGLWPIDTRCHVPRNQHQRISVAHAISFCIASGLYMNVARRCGTENIYKSIPLRFPTVGKEPKKCDPIMVHCHPTSVLCEVVPRSESDVSEFSSEYVVFQELVFGGKIFMRNVQSVSPTDLRVLRSTWTPSHPNKLCGRTESPETACNSFSPGASSSKRPREIENEQAIYMTSGSNSSKSAGDSISAAKARYMARKHK